MNEKFDDRLISVRMKTRQLRISNIFRYWHFFNPTISYFDKIFLSVYLTGHIFEFVWRDLFKYKHAFKIWSHFLVEKFFLSTLFTFSNYVFQYCRIIRIIIKTIILWRILTSRKLRRKKYNLFTLNIILLEIKQKFNQRILYWLR